MDYTNSSTTDDSTENDDFSWTDDSSDDVAEVSAKPKTSRPKRAVPPSKKTPKALVLEGIAKMRELEALGKEDQNTVLKMLGKGVKTLDEAAAALVTGSKADSSGLDIIDAIADDPVRGAVKAHVAVDGASFRGAWAMACGSMDMPRSHEDRTFALVDAVSNMDKADLERLRSVAAVVKG